MDRFDKELKQDNEFLDLIWINYFGTRNLREEAAKKKWDELINGNIEYIKTGEFIGMNSLNRFVKFSVKNHVYSTKLIKKYFSRVREFSKEIGIGEAPINLVNDENEDVSLEESISNKMEKINSMIDKEFEIEYEKMVRLNEIFDDVSLFSEIGWDLSKFSKGDLFNIAKLDDVLKNRVEIINFIKNLGKIESPEEKLRKTDSKSEAFYKNEYFSIEFGDKIDRIIPSELSYFHNNSMKKRFYSKYIEKKLFNYSMLNIEEEKKSNIKREKGPLIICMDSSSSMNGLPEEICKSIILFLYKECKKSHRDLYVISFGSIDEIDELNITDKDNGLSTLLSFLKKRFLGGTDFYSPLKRAFELIQNNEYKKCDILFLSDGIGKMEKTLLDDILNKKHINETKIFSILLREDNESLSFSDEILNYYIKNNKTFIGEITVYDKIGHYEYLDKH